jgi:dihydropteroate synthase
VTTRHLRCGDTVLPLGERTLLMGVVNITPDSFSDGGLYLDAQHAVDHARRLLADGSDILDLGAESTRPGSAPISADEELSRLLPVIERLVADGVRCISVDTSKAVVAEAALAAGASWVNDVTGLADPRMASVATAADALVLMHQRPTTAGEVSDAVHYDDVVAEVSQRLDDARSTAVAAGVHPDRIVLDPGIGFGKTVDDNLVLLAELPRLAELGQPLLVGVSRKRFVAALSGAVDVEERDIATVGAGCAAASRGAAILRVHDVRSHRLALALVDAIDRIR